MRQTAAKMPLSLNRIMGLFAGGVGQLRDSLVINAGYIFGMSAASALAGFVFWNLAARLYSLEEVGVASAVISIARLLSDIAGLGLGVGLVRYLSDARDAERMLNTAITIVAITSVLIGGLYLVGMKIWFPALAIIRGSLAFLIVFSVFITAASVGGLAKMAFVGLRKAKYAFWQVVTTNGVRLGLIGGLTFAGAIGIVFSLALALVAGSVIGLLVFVPRLLKGYRLRARWSGPIAKRLVPYSAGNYLADVLYSVPIQLASPLALELIGKASSAQAYIAWMLGAMISSPGLALAGSAFAEGAHAPGELRAILSKAARYAVGITVPAALFVIVAAPWILSLFGEGYVVEESTALLRLLAIAAPLVVINGLYFSALRVRKRIGELVLLSGVTVALYLAIVVPTIQQLGLVATGIGWLGSQILVTIVASCHYFYGRS